jgi:hypothetical protein
VPLFKEVYGDMLIVEYLVRVGDEELKPCSEVEDARFFSVAELPRYYVELFTHIVKEVQEQS